MDIETIKIKAVKARQLGGTVEIVGAWVWVSFAEKPSPEVRQALKDEKFHWNRTRQLWQYAGIKSGPSPADSWSLRQKYQAYQIDSDANLPVVR